MSRTHGGRTEGGINRRPSAPGDFSDRSSPTSPREHDVRGGRRAKGSPDQNRVGAGNGCRAAPFVTLMPTVPQRSTRNFEIELTLTTRGA